MNIREINNFFGDMDLFLIDLILKDKIPESGNVLDVGCGSARNGLYFLLNGYQYTGIDTDESQLILLRSMLRSANVKANLLNKDICDYSDDKENFDFIVCSRLLHLVETKEIFLQAWSNILTSLKKGGMIYLAMDSVLGTDIAKQEEDGRYKFPDSKVRFALNQSLLTTILEDTEEVVPTKTLVHHNERAQSYLLLRKL